MITSTILDYNGSAGRTPPSTTRHQNLTSFLIQVVSPTQARPIHVETIGPTHGARMGSTLSAGRTMLILVMLCLAEVTEDIVSWISGEVGETVSRFALTEVSTLPVLADVHQMAFLSQCSVAHLPHQLGLDLIPKSIMRLATVMLI